MSEYQSQSEEITAKEILIALINKCITGGKIENVAEDVCKAYEKIYRQIKDFK
jgi:hypothetical protein